MKTCQLRTQGYFSLLKICYHQRPISSILTAVPPPLLSFFGSPPPLNFYNSLILSYPSAYCRALSASGIHACTPSVTLSQLSYYSLAH